MSSGEREGRCGAPATRSSRTWTRRTGAFVGHVRVDQLDNATFPRTVISPTWTSAGSARASARRPTSTGSRISLGSRHLRPSDGGRPGQVGRPAGHDLRSMTSSRPAASSSFPGTAQPVVRSSYGLSKGSSSTGSPGAAGRSFRPPTSAGRSKEATSGPAPRGPSNLKAAGSVFLAAETMLGPFYFAYGYAGSKHSSFYVLSPRYF